MSAAPMEGAAIAAAWYLKSEGNEPLGQVYRSGDDAVPVPGALVTVPASSNEAKIVRFRELGPTCAMRRFEVIVRLLD